MINKIGKKVGFTLTEILLAIVIVGVIAALVLPSVITRYNNNSLAKLEERIHSTLQESIDSLPVTENTDFFETMMYFPTEGEIDYDEYSGKFLKKYMRVSRYCGVNAGNCFATKYYEHVNGQKRNYIPNYYGACASLKNGASICLTPQSWTNEGSDICPKVLVDLNGKKGPNVRGIDLREFELSCHTRTALARTSHDVNVDESNIDTDDDDDDDDDDTQNCVEICEGNPESSLCLQCTCAKNFNNVNPCTVDSSSEDCKEFGNCMTELNDKIYLKNKCRFIASCTLNNINSMAYSCNLSMKGGGCSTNPQIILTHDNMNGGNYTTEGKGIIASGEGANKSFSINFVSPINSLMLGGSNIQVNMNNSTIKSGKFFTSDACSISEDKHDGLSQYKKCEFKYEHTNVTPAP